MNAWRRWVAGWTSQTTPQQEVVTCDNKPLHLPYTPRPFFQLSTPNPPSFFFFKRDEDLDTCHHRVISGAHCCTYAGDKNWPVHVTVVTTSWGPGFDRAPRAPSLSRRRSPGYEASSGCRSPLRAVPATRGLPSEGDAADGVVLGVARCPQASARGLRGFRCAAS
jgi:hypothetical protein